MSLMNNQVMQILKHSAIQSVQYSQKILRTGKSKLHDTINRTLCNNFWSASEKYCQHLDEETIEKDSKERALNVLSGAEVSKKKAKLTLQKKADKEKQKMTVK